MTTNEHGSSHQNKSLSIFPNSLQEIQDALLPFFSSTPTIAKVSGNLYQFDGEVKLDNPCCDYRFSRTANVTLRITLDDLIGEMPIVQVNELWMRKSANWHCYQNGQLCWELEERWKNKLSEIEEKHPPHKEVLKFAIVWCLESSICLISRHWYAHVHNLTEWPKEWKFWEHGDKGVRKYEQRKWKQKRTKSKRAH